MGIEDRVEATHAIGQAAWPGVGLPLDAWRRRCQALTPARDEETAHVADLWLACACEQGAPGALAAFDAAHRAVLRRAAERLAPSSIGADDLLQLLYTKLFVGDGRAPSIGAYAGRGSLQAWLRMSLAHLALDQRRARGQREIPVDGELLAWPDPAADPELAAIRERHGADFKAAFAYAMSTLSARERTLLRQQVLHQMTLDQLAGLHRVHRSAVARWLADARQTLLIATRQRLVDQLGANRAQVESLIGLLQSQFDASLERLLAATA